MMKFIELYIGSIILWSIYYIIGKILFQFNRKVSSTKLIIVILIFSIFLSILNMINAEIMHGIIKISVSYFMFFCYYKILFNMKNSELIIGSFILYLSVFISETILAIIISLIFEFINYDSMLFLKNNIIINAIVSYLAYFIIKINKNKLIELTKNSKYNSKGSFIIIFVILLASTLLVFKIPLDNWKFDIEFIITMIILLSFCVIAILTLKQRADIQKTTAMYQQLVEYSDITNGLLEDYRIVSHEHKNQLLIIRSMLETKDKEINDYVDNLLEKRDGIKYQWIGELNRLPISGLKGLINYKLIEMEKNKINTSISISKDLIKMKLNNLSTKQKDNLYSIIGIYLDNAIQAAKSSGKKEISLEIYKDNKEVVIILANTYKGKIDLDKIDDYGYTTKGKNRGVGLHIVKNIIETEVIFNSKKYLLDNYFVQEIRINLKDIR